MSTGVLNVESEPSDGLASHPRGGGGVEILLVASCYWNRRLAQAWWATWLLYRLHLPLKNDNCVFVAEIVLSNVLHCLFKQLWIFCGLLFVFRPSLTHVAVVLRAITLQLTYLPVQGRLIVMITTLNF